MRYAPLMHFLSRPFRRLAVALSLLTLLAAGPIACVEVVQAVTMPRLGPFKPY